MSGTVYAAIGDVHGRLDLLEPLFEKVKQSLLETFPDSIEKRIVFLGDYIDRGPSSRGVLDFLVRAAADPMNIVLPGNHEELMWECLSAADDEDLVDATRVWFANGGLETLRSYLPDNHPAFQTGIASNEWVLHDALNAIPSSHKSLLDWLLNGKPVFHLDAEEGLFFVHAGIHPSRNLEDHRHSEFLWSRHKSFLRGDLWVEHLKVIHGHTISSKPVLMGNRVGIDTGAFQSGRLTACILSGDGPRIIVEEEIGK